MIPLEGECRGDHRDRRSQTAYPGERTPDRKSLLSWASTAENAQASSENVSAHLMMRAAADLFKRAPGWRGGTPGAIFTPSRTTKMAPFPRTVRSVGDARTAPGLGRMRSACKATSQRNRSASYGPLFTISFDEYMLEIAPGYQCSKSHPRMRAASRLTRRSRASAWPSRGAGRSPSTAHSGKFARCVTSAPRQHVQDCACVPSTAYLKTGNG